MGRWITETTLCWQEPAWSVRRRCEQEWKALRLRPWILFVFLFMTARWAGREHSLEWNTPAARLEHLATLLLGALYAALPWATLKISPFFPYHISITDHGIRSRGAWMLLKDLERCELDVCDVEGHRCAWLDVFLKKGSLRSFAVAENISLRQLEEALQLQGIPAVRHPSA
jgi:hypothetical protein